MTIHMELVGCPVCERRWMCQGVYQKEYLWFCSECTQPYCPLGDKIDKWVICPNCQDFEDSGKDHGGLL